MNQAAQNTGPSAVGNPHAGDALVAVTLNLARARSLDEIMSVVSHAVRTLLQADGATFVLRDGDRCYYAEEDAVSPLWKGRRFPMSACISGWCMQHRQSVALADIYQDPRIPADAYRPTFVRSLAMAPVGRHEPVAALGAYWAELHQPRPDEMEHLQAIADAAALAVTNLPSPQAGTSDASAPPRTLREHGPEAASRPRSLGAFVTRVRHNGLRPNSLEAYVFAVMCVLAATLVRAGVDATGVRGLAVYSTFYPAVLLTMLIGGRRSSILATLLGGLSAYYFFMPPAYKFGPLTLSDVLNFSLYGGASALIILIIDSYQRAVRRLRQEDARHLTLAREQGHRVQNAFAIIEAVVQQSLRDQPERSRTITRRIRAGLAQIDLQEGGASLPRALRDLFTAELEPFDLTRFTFEGEGMWLPPRARSILSLVIHELATNAVKHGALSVPDGRVKVAWDRCDGRGKIVWLEAGGPPVRPPQKRGYGSVLMQRLVQAESGAFTIGYQPTGVTAEISCPSLSLSLTG